MNEEKYRQSKNQEIKVFERAIILPLYIFFETNFSNRWARLLSKKILSENFFNDILDEKRSIMLILSIFFRRLWTVKKFIMIYYVRHIFWQVLSNPTIWKYRCKISLRNIETRTEIIALHKLSFWLSFIDCFFNNDLMK